jgi:hypothetical protein
MSADEALIPGQEYSAISLRPPWAWAVMFGGKDVENRSWPTKRRGRILIHASSHKASRDDEEWLRDELSSLTHMTRNALPAAFERSAILGSVELVDCVTNSRSRWAQRGEYHWILRDPRPLATPVRGVNGKLQFWRWTFGEAAPTNEAAARQGPATVVASEGRDTNASAGSAGNQKADFDIGLVTTEQILSALQRVSKTEPEFELNLLRAVSQDLGCKRMGARVHRELKARLRTAIRRGILIREGKFLRRA